MIDFRHDYVRDLIELARHDHPFCTHCGTPTTIVEREGSLYLECFKLGLPRPPVRRLLSVGAGHDRRLIADAVETGLAA